jgi:hypothetical protein
MDTNIVIKDAAKPFGPGDRRDFFAEISLQEGQ